MLNKPRMTPDRHWERFDEADHGNAQQMKSIAENAIEELLTMASEPPSIKPHLFRELVNQLRDIAVDYHNTQQLRERIAHLVGDYIGVKK